MAATADTLHATLKLLSDPTRLRLLALLSREELAVQELVAITGLSQSRISNHLALLKRAGLVQDRREGSWSFYSLVPPGGGSALSAELQHAAVEPYLECEEGHADAMAVEAVREQRRERSRQAHDALAERWMELGPEFTGGSLRVEALSLAVPQELTVADLGCGTGFLSSFLASRVRRVIAVDHAPKMLEAARRRGLPESVEFRRGEFDALPLRDDEVDAAFANLVWHHLPDLDAAARELFRVVRPGGTVVLSDLLPHEEDWMREHMGDLRLGLRPDQVLAVLARAGFTELHSETCRDRYRVEGPEDRIAELPLFLARGVVPARGGNGIPPTTLTDPKRGNPR